MEAYNAGSFAARRFAYVPVKPKRDASRCKSPPMPGASQYLVTTLGQVASKSERSALPWNGGLTAKNSFLSKVEVEPASAMPSCRGKMVERRIKRKRRQWRGMRGDWGAGPSLRQFGPVHSKHKLKCARIHDGQGSHATRDF